MGEVVVGRAQDLLEEAQNLVKAKAWTEALRKFEGALALFRESGADEDAARTLYKISLLPEETAGYKSRLATARDAAAIFGKLGKWGDAAEALDHAAHIQNQKAKALSEISGWRARRARKSAHKTWRKAAGLYEQAGEVLESARTRLNLGQELQIHEQDYATALRHYAAAEPVLRRLGNDSDMAMLLFFKGVALFFWRGGNAEVVGLLREAVGLYQKIGDRQGAALAFKYIVEAATAYDRSAARRYANMALAFAWENEDDSLARDVQDLLFRMMD
jgi:tetratricopeptide (TPR) repeat protein